jgi:uncharacterized lipoprotein YajG
MARKTIQDRCVPREATSATNPVARNVTETIRSDDPREAKSLTSSAAKPNHAIVVMCHANRSVPYVNASLPNSGGSGLRKSRVRM